MPANQIDFQKWLLSAAASIIHWESLPDSPIFSLDAPAVKGLVIYGARCGSLKFFAAWIGWSGTFTGWMVVRPAAEGVASDFGVGEILGKPLDTKVSLDMKGHLAVDRFIWELKKVAWAIGIADD